MSLAAELRAGLQALERIHVTHVSPLSLPAPVVATACDAALLSSIPPASLPGLTPIATPQAHAPSPPDTLSPDEPAVAQSSVTPGHRLSHTIPVVRPPREAIASPLSLSVPHLQTSAAVPLALLHPHRASPPSPPTPPHIHSSLSFSPDPPTSPARSAPSRAHSLAFAAQPAAARGYAAVAHSAHECAYAPSATGPSCASQCPHTAPPPHRRTIADVLGAAAAAAGPCAPHAVSWRGRSHSASPRHVASPPSSSAYDPSPTPASLPSLVAADTPSPPLRTGLFQWVDAPPSADAAAHAATHATISSPSPIVVAATAPPSRPAACAADLPHCGPSPRRAARSCDPLLSPTCADVVTAVAHRCSPAGTAPASLAIPAQSERAARSARSAHSSRVARAARASPASAGGPRPATGAVAICTAATARAPARGVCADGVHVSLADALAAAVAPLAAIAAPSVHLAVGSSTDEEADVLAVDVGASPRPGGARGWAAGDAAVSADGPAADTSGCDESVAATLDGVSDDPRDRISAALRCAAACMAASAATRAASLGSDDGLTVADPADTPAAPEPPAASRMASLAVHAEAVLAFAQAPQPHVQASPHGTTATPRRGLPSTEPAEDGCGGAAATDPSGAGATPAAAAHAAPSDLRLCTASFEEFTGAQTVPLGPVFDAAAVSESVTAAAAAAITSRVAQKAVAAARAELLTADATLRVHEHSLRTTAGALRAEHAAAARAEEANGGWAIPQVDTAAARKPAGSTAGSAPRPLLDHQRVLVLPNSAKLMLAADGSVAATHSTVPPVAAMPPRSQGAHGSIARPPGVPVSTVSTASVLTPAPHVGPDTLALVPVQRPAAEPARRSVWGAATDTHAAYWDAGVGRRVRGAPMIPTPQLPHSHHAALPETKLVLPPGAGGLVGRLVAAGGTAQPAPPGRRSVWAGTNALGASATASFSSSVGVVYANGRHSKAGASCAFAPVPQPPILIPRGGRAAAALSDAVDTSAIASTVYSRADAAEALLVPPADGVPPVVPIDYLLGASCTPLCEWAATGTDAADSDESQSPVASSGAGPRESPPVAGGRARSEVAVAFAAAVATTTAGLDARFVLPMTGVALPPSAATAAALRPPVPAGAPADASVDVRMNVTFSSAASDPAIIDVDTSAFAAALFDPVAERTYTSPVHDHGTAPPAASPTCSRAPVTPSPHAAVARGTPSQTLTTATPAPFPSPSPLPLADGYADRTLGGEATALAAEQSLFSSPFPPTPSRSALVATCEWQGGVAACMGAHLVSPPTRPHDALAGLHGFGASSRWAPSPLHGSTRSARSRSPTRCLSPPARPAHVPAGDRCGDAPACVPAGSHASPGAASAATASTSPPPRGRCPTAACVYALYNEDALAAGTDDDATSELSLDDGASRGRPALADVVAFVVSDDIHGTSPPHAGGSQDPSDASVHIFVHAHASTTTSTGGPSEVGSIVAAVAPPSPTEPHMRTADLHTVRPTESAMLPPPSLGVAPSGGACLAYCDASPFTSNVGTVAVPSVGATRGDGETGATGSLRGAPVCGRMHTAAPDESIDGCDAALRLVLYDDDEAYATFTEWGGWEERRSVPLDARPPYTVQGNPFDHQETYDACAVPAHSVAPWPEWAFASTNAARAAAAAASPSILASPAAPLVAPAPPAACAAPTPARSQLDRRTIRQLRRSLRSADTAALRATAVAMGGALANAEPATSSAYLSDTSMATTSGGDADDGYGSVLDARVAAERAALLAGLHASASSGGLPPRARAVIDSTLHSPGANTTTAFARGGMASIADMSGESLYIHVDCVADPAAFAADPAVADDACVSTWQWVPTDTATSGLQTGPSAAAWTTAVSRSPLQPLKHAPTNGALGTTANAMAKGHADPYPRTGEDKVDTHAAKPAAPALLRDLGVYDENAEGAPGVVSAYHLAGGDTPILVGGGGRTLADGLVRMLLR